MEYFLSVLGFIILISSGHFLVKGSVSLARFFGLSTLVIGVTIVAFGTSAPELLVSIQAAVGNHPEMALGNVVGSNISNIALILAITAIILPIPVNRNSIIIDWPVMMGASILLAIFALDRVLTFPEGLIFLLILVAFIWFIIRKSRKAFKPDAGEEENSTYSMPVSIIVIVISVAGLALGARLLVNNATIIAQDLGVSERAIAVSMIAVGTSLPELVTSVIAAIQKQTDISVGNIIGSNIFNVLSVLGIAAMVKPIQVSELILVDIAVMLAFSLILLFMMLPPRVGKIIRAEGLILLAGYFGYLVYVFK
ncbi:MAG: calcium/sodium antiporter [Bacteroidales bacterium]|nr:calcium/sodium antiporter [Bacteroidales bacterium]